MSLTRYLPTPSDRMGILWTLLQIEDAIILEYGTLGTTTYATKTFGMMGMDVGNKLFATGLDESNVVMGDTSNLEGKLKELDGKYRPKVIFVLASSVSSVTGADVKGVCTYMQGEIGAKIIVFTEGGFGGDYSSGIQSAYTTLVSQLATTAYEAENCYNILGVSAMEKNARADVAEIQRMMGEYFGLQAHGVLSFDTDLTKIGSMSKAKVNLVLSYEGIKGAEILKERFGTPYVYGLPVGYGGTLQWLLDIAKELPLILNKDIIREISPKIEKDGSTKKVAIYGAYDMAIALSAYMEQLGAEVDLLLCSHEIRKIKDKPEHIHYIKEEKAKIQAFAQLENTLILGDNCFANHANRTNKKINVQNGHTLLGIRGAKYLANGVE